MNKKAVDMALEIPVYWIIAILLAALIVLGLYLLLTGKIHIDMDALRNALRFGR